MPVFRPSMVCNFKIEFDSALTGHTPPAPQSVDSRVATPPLPGQITTTFAGTTVTTSYAYASPPSKTTKPSTQPLLTATGNPVSRILARIPKSGSIELPGYRQAGQFTLLFDFRDFPIDPRLLRATSVDIHLGTVGDADAADGFRGKKRNGTLTSVLTTQDPQGLPNADTLRISGIVDDIEITHGDKGSTVEAKGRDFRGILIDTPISVAPGAQEQLLDELDLTQPVDNVVAQSLYFTPWFRQFNVVVNSAEWKAGVVPAPCDPGAVPRHRKAARPAKSGTKEKVHSNPAGGAKSMSFWDLIVQYCYVVGAIPFFRGTQLYIRPARSIFDQLRNDLDPVQNPTPFRDGKLRVRDMIAHVAINPGLRVRRMVYGRDVITWKFHRKYTSFRKPKFIRVVGAVDHTTGEAAIGVWPDPTTTSQDQNTTSVAPGGQLSAQDFSAPYPVPLVSDPAQLQEIARGLYEEICRGEMGGEVETNNLASFGGDNDDPDLLRLNPGDGMEFFVDTRTNTAASPLVSELTNSEREAFEAQVQNITDRLGDAQLARTIVLTTRGQLNDIQRYFRVQTVKYSWDASRGVKVSFDFQNYYVQRAQIQSASPAAGSAAITTTPKQ